MAFEEVLINIDSLELKGPHSEMDMLTYLMVGKFDHITDRIWNSLDSPTIANCRLVSKMWRAHLEKTWKKYVLKRIKDYETAIFGLSSNDLSDID